MSIEDDILVKREEWRVGRKVPINVYCGDRPVCQCHNELDARAIVDGMNSTAERRRQLSEALDKNCRLQDDVAAIVSSHRSDWSWNEVLSDVTAARDYQVTTEEVHRYLDSIGVEPGKHAPCEEDDCNSHLMHRVRAIVRERDDLQRRLTNIIEGTR